MFYFTSYTICYLWVLSVQHTVKNNLDNETKTLHHHYMGYSFRLAARNLFVRKESFCKKGTFISTIPHTESTYHGLCYPRGARCSSMVRTFTHGAMGCQIDPSWGGCIELFLVPARAPRLV